MRESKKIQTIESISKRCLNQINSFSHALSGIVSAAEAPYPHLQALWVPITHTQVRCTPPFMPYGRGWGCACIQQAFYSVLRMFMYAGAGGSDIPSKDWQ